MKNVGISELFLMVDSLLKIIAERGSHKFYKSIDVHYVTNAIDKIEVSMVFLTFFVGK